MTAEAGLTAAGEGATPVLTKLSPVVGKVREVVVGAGEAVGAGSAAISGAVEKTVAAARAKVTRANSGRRKDVFMEEILDGRRRAVSKVAGKDKG